MEDERLSLEPERLKQITFIALKTFFEFGLYEEDFDIVETLKRQGIVAIPYSNFDPKSLEKMKSFKISYWGLGLFCRYIDENGKEIKIIAFDDSKSQEDVLIIIFHELAHCELKHTQQCTMGEIEACSFATAIIALIYALKDVFAAEKTTKVLSRKKLIDGLELFLKTNKEVKKCLS